MSDQPIPQEIKEKIIAYEEAKIELKRLDALCKELQPEIIPYLPKDSISNGKYGTFSFNKKTTWTYPPETEAIEQELKERKKADIAKGIAHGEESYVLIYKEDAKEEE